MAEGGDGCESRGPRGLASSSYSGRLLPLAGPAEIARPAGYRNLRPGPAEPAGDTGERVGQRAACGLGAVLASDLHGECSPVLPVRPAALSQVGM